MNIIIGISCFLAIIQSILFWNKKPGVSVFVFTVTSVILLIYVLGKNRKIVNKKALIFVIPILLLSSTYFIFNNILFQILNTFIIVALGIIMCVYLTKKKIKCPELMKKSACVIGGMFESISDVIDHVKIPESKRDQESFEKLRKLGKALIIAIPIIVVVLLLLMSADQIFEQIFDKIFLDLSDILSVDGVIKLISRLAIILIVFLLCAGFIVNLVKDNTLFNEENNEDIDVNFKFENLTINMILTVLNVIYLIFSFIQITNLFIHTGNNPNFDYSSYARQGFFQLMFVSFINFVILIVANINKTEKTKRQKVYNKVMSLLIVIFTIIIIVSAFYRMNLYQETYGYTYLRIFVDFVLITEGLITIPVIIKLLGIKIDLLKTSIIISTFMYVILNFINIDNFIAQKNIERYFLDPENSNFDINYLCDLGTDATKEMVKLLNSNDEYIVKRTENYLLDQKQNLDFEGRNWQEYNISKKRAKEILEKQNIDLNYYL